MDVSDHEEIARGLKAGSPDAWRRLHEAYARRVWQVAARMTGADSASVADIVQETFLAAAQSAGGFDPRRGTLWAWLWGIVRRQTALYYRKRGPAEDLRRAREWWASLNGQRREMLRMVAESPSDRLESRELALLVRDTLAELPEDYQILLTAKYVEDMTTQQIALDVGISASAVDSKLARAREAFRRAFAKVTRSPEYVSEVRI